LRYRQVVHEIGQLPRDFQVVPEAVVMEMVHGGDLLGGGLLAVDGACGGPGGFSWVWLLCVRFERGMYMPNANWRRRG